MKIFVPNLPHTQTTSDYSWCAYSDKVRKFCNMMTDLGYEVILLGGEKNEARCSEHVVCITEAEQAEHFKERIPRFESSDSGWQLFAANAINAVRERQQPGDYLGLIGGLAQKPISDALPDLTIVEWGVGYGGVFCDYRVFESYAWMHTVYGKIYGAHESDGHFYDTVIPNSFELQDFPEGKGDGEYLLFIGRLTARKGVQIVADVAKRTGLPLVVAGEGDTDLLNLFPPGTDYRGRVGPKERAEIMGGAIATLVPTIYIEPFGGVNVESQLCGTPAIGTPWGGLTETISNGVSGYYKNYTLKDFCDSVQRIQDGQISREETRKWAIRYTTDVVKFEYQEYFDRLEGLRANGWYN